jgi:hypothetical protein
MKLFNSMKNILSKWRGFLLTEALDAYDENSQITLYHYSPTNEDTLTLDPQRFLQHNQWSRNDFNSSSQPRVFFYVDLAHAEAMVKEGATLYSARVNTKDIYDMSVDDLGLKQKAMYYPGIPASIDFDWILKSLADAIPESWNKESILPAGSPTYKGTYYRLQNMDVVVWFHPIQVQKTHEEEV